MPLHVLHHHDGVVHHQAHGEHDRKQREQVDGEARHLHQENRSDQRNRDGDHWNEDGPERPQEQKDDDDDDQQGLAQGVQHLVDRVLNIGRRIVGDANLHPGGQLRLNPRDGFPNLFDDFQRVCRWKHPNAHKGRCFSIETNIGVVVLRAQYNVRDLAQTHDDAALLLDNQLLKFLRRAQIGVGHQIYGNHAAFCASQRRKIVVLGERVAHVRGRDSARRHLVGLQPNPHREGTVAENVRSLHATDRAQFGLHYASEVIRNLILVQFIGREPDVHRGELVISGL